MTPIKKKKVIKFNYYKNVDVRVIEELIENDVIMILTFNGERTNTLPNTGYLMLTEYYPKYTMRCPANCLYIWEPHRGTISIDKDDANLVYQIIVKKESETKQRDAFYASK